MTRETAHLGTHLQLFTGQEVTKPIHTPQLETKNILSYRLIKKIRREEARQFQWAGESLQRFEWMRRDPGIFFRFLPGRALLPPPPTKESQKQVALMLPLPQPGTREGHGNSHGDGLSLCGWGHLISLVLLRGKARGCKREKGARGEKHRVTDRLDPSAVSRRLNEFNAAELNVSSGVNEIQASPRSERY